MLSIQQANEVAKMVADEFGVPPPPQIFVTSNLSPKYAGAFYHNGVQHIKIRPEYFGEPTVAHEVGHYIFHERRPGDCHGQNPECEEVAQMIERWWVNKRKKEHTLIDGQTPPNNYKPLLEAGALFAAALVPLTLALKK
jgi:hypothetical protein